MSDHCKDHHKYDPNCLECLDAMNASETSELAPAPCSASPDCCEEWTRSEKALNDLVVFAAVHDVKYQGAFFNYCPWCGRVRPNAQPQARGLNDKGKHE